MTGFLLDETLADAFDRGALDPRGEAVLAEQVARVLPFRWALPHRTAAALTRVVDRVGDEPALLAWLGGRPGVPRLVASVYALIGLLDRLSDRPAVVDALRETRRQIGLPASLEARLVPDPDAPGKGVETLASLGGQIELLLAEEQYTEATRTALAAADMLRHVVSRAAQVDPELTDVVGQVERVRDDLDNLEAVS